MNFLKSTSGSVRTKRIVAMGATAAVLFSGAGLVAANTFANAESVTAVAEDFKGTAVNAKDGTTTQVVGGSVRVLNFYTGLQGRTNYYALSRLVDSTTGEQVGDWAGINIKPADYGTGSYELFLKVPEAASGRTLVAQSYIVNATDYTGSLYVPTGIKEGATPLKTMAALTDASKTVTVPAVPGMTAPEAPIGSQPTTAPGTAPNATIVTTATDKADGDKTVAANGIIKDVVNYTGLNPGGVYVLQTTLWNKTDGFATPVNLSKIFVPKTATGSITVEVPVPAGYEGKDLVVFQTIYNGADAVVGKHLNVVKIRDGKTYLVAHRDPNDTAQTVKVPKNLLPCKVSGYVWKDANKNGLMDADEQRVAGVGVDLRQVPGVDNAGSFVKTTTTNADGYYEFTLDGSQCGHQFITDFNEATFPADWKPFGGGDSNILPYAPNSGWTNVYTLNPGDDLKRIDGGLRQYTGATVGGNICMVESVGYTIELLDATTKAVVATTTVNSSGSFALVGVPAGQYVVQMLSPSYEYFRADGRQTGFTISVGGSIITAAPRNLDPTHWQGVATTAPFDLAENAVIKLDACGAMESPLVLDLNGNGKVDTSSVASQAGAGFDLLSTGSKVDSGWVAKGDGLLVTPNADGTVTSGDNLFGGSLGDGYAKLAKLDTNNDGAVSGAELDGVKVWVDANSDHVSQAGEIKSLGDYGIVSLSTKYTNAPVVDNGNVVVEHGVATKADGSSVVVGDAYFQLGALSAANAAAAGKAQAATNAKLATLPVAEAKSIREAFKNAAK